MGAAKGGQVTGTQGQLWGGVVKLREENAGTGAGGGGALGPQPRLPGGTGPSTPTLTQVSYKPDDLNS